MLKRPIQARIDHVFEKTADAKTVRECTELAHQKGLNCSIKRVVEYVPDEKEYCTYTEADDRMM
jgi:hypothetical protein